MSIFGSGDRYMFLALATNGQTYEYEAQCPAGIVRAADAGLAAVAVLMAALILITALG